MEGAPQVTMVSTRLMAGLIAIIPLYSLSVLAAFFAARFTTVYINGQSGGLYDHYFHTFLNPTDLLWSFLQAIVMSIGVMLVHTYYGFTASGGPAGVGGRGAIRIFSVLNHER